jgi:transient receptor potential cation channel subfamily V protein 5
MAIVNENPLMVRYLLSHGADVNQRCCGRFFLPDDQKNKLEAHRGELPRLPTHTNYHGLTYFGEYPLTFAAILGHDEGIRLLVAYGADINKQDSNGNTALHLLVINDNFVLFWRINFFTFSFQNLSIFCDLKEVFKLLTEMNASLDLANNQGLTPLTLAASLARKEVSLNFMFNASRNKHLIGKSS